jgi:ribosome modulation factor
MERIMPKIDREDLDINWDNHEQADQAFEVLRALRYLLKRIKLEGRKSWKVDELIGLLEDMLIEIAEGVTEEDKLRQIEINRGNAAFKAGLARDKNPYPTNSEQYRWWDTGWRDGERERKAADGSAVEIHQGRVQATAEKAGARHYKVRVIIESVAQEWNEVLRQLSGEGQGSLFSDYEEAKMAADHLKRATGGIVTVVEV